MRAGRRPDGRSRSSGTATRRTRVPARAPGPRPRVGELQRTATTATGGRRPWPSPSTTTASPGYEVRAYETRAGRAARRGQGDPEDELAGHPARLARRPHLGHDRFRADADPTIFNDAKITGAYILDPWYPRRLEHLGPVRPARARSRTRPRWSRNYLQVEAARGPLPGPRRPVHRGRPDASGAVAGRADPIRRTRDRPRNTASRTSLAIIPAA